MQRDETRRTRLVDVSELVGDYVVVLVVVVVINLWIQQSDALLIITQAQYSDEHTNLEKEAEHGETLRFVDCSADLVATVRPVHEMELQGKNAARDYSRTQ